MSIVRHEKPTELVASRDKKPVATPLKACSFEDLVEQHQGMVWRYLRLLGADPDEADDLMQDTFVRVAEGRKRGEQLLVPAAFLRSVARNLLVGARRRASLRTPTVEWIDVVDRCVDSQPEVIDDARIEAMRRCVARLDGRMRQAVQWHHQEGLSCLETASRLGIGVHGTKSLLSRARQELRKCVDQQMQGGQPS